MSFPLVEIRDGTEWLCRCGRIENRGGRPHLLLALPSSFIHLPRMHPCREGAAHLVTTPGGFTTSRWERVGGGGFVQYIHVFQRVMDTVQGVKQ